MDQGAVGNCWFIAGIDKIEFLKQFIIPEFECVKSIKDVWA